MSAPGAAAVLDRWAGRRYLVRWRGIDVPAYTAMLYLGCVAGVLAGAVVAGSFGLEGSRFALATIILLIPAFAGARLWFVLEHRSVYRNDLRRAWRRAEGGSALYGGLLLSLAVSVPVLALFEIPFWTFWDAAGFTMLVGLILTRVGCLMNGCCAGRLTSGPLGVRLPDHHGVWERRIPTQLLEAGWATLVLVGAALLRAGRPFAGAVLVGVLAAYGAGRLLLEPTRASAGSGGSRANVAFSALLFVSGSMALTAGWSAAS
jgi:phosphatidylglycerol---prolipoprotein diacylglyceryl transferase